MSEGRGKHHSQVQKQLGQIPHRSLLAVGATVLLTKNQKGLTHLGLNNGAMGKVISILYTPKTAPPEFPQAVVVDFPAYKGEAWIPEHPTWVPIPVDQGMCEGHCCSRKGLPLMPGFAITIATHARVKLQPKTDMEHNCLGTAFSRCEKESNWCLVEPIPQQRLFYINEHPRMKPRRDEEQQFQNLSRNTIAKYADYSDIYTYVNPLRELDLFCANGVHDSIFSSNENNCCCVLCLKK